MRCILWAGYPQVGVYPKSIYSIAPILSILSIMASILHDRDCPIYRIRYTDRADYPMDRIPAGRTR